MCELLEEIFFQDCLRRILHPIRSFVLRQTYYTIRFGRLAILCTLKNIIAHSCFGAVLFFFCLYASLEAAGRLKNSSCRPQTDLPLLQPDAETARRDQKQLRRKELRPQALLSAPNSFPFACRRPGRSPAPCCWMQATVW